MPARYGGGIARPPGIEQLKQLLARGVVVGRDGRLYFGSGSTCDMCVERDPRSATILSVCQDGTGFRIEARG